MGGCSRSCRQLIFGVTGDVAKQDGLYLITMLSPLHPHDRILAPPADECLDDDVVCISKDPGVWKGQIEDSTATDPTVRTIIGRCDTPCEGRTHGP